MRPRLAVPVAALLGACALAAPAVAQTCAPPSAEHAFEELLDIAADDSPLEDEAWRVADEQEAAGKFETAETRRMIDELARSNDLTYDCATRRYVPVSHPDPRDAIENDEEPVYEGPTGVPGDSGQPAGGTTGPGSGGSTPGGTGGAATGPGSGSEASGVAGGGGVNLAPGDGPGVTEGSATGESAGSGLRVSGAGPSHSGERTGDQAAPASKAETADAPGAEIGKPAGTPDGEGGAVALPGEEPASNALPRLAVGSVTAMAVAVAWAGLTGRTRRRRVRELTQHSRDLT